MIDAFPRLGQPRHAAEFALVAVKPLRQPGIDGIDEGGERLRVGAGERFAERMQRRCVSSAGRRSS